MNNNMNSKIQTSKFNLSLITLLTISCFSLSLTTEAQANTNVSKKAPIKVASIVDVEMKCHVELMGGGEVIRFTNTPYTSLKKLTEILLTQKVKLDSSDSPRAIYKVKECVPLKGKFSSSRAQQLFQNTPW
ncbi:MAG: TapY2 family type IVa secretion system protein [Colwellia sp.]|nr:TapY2 family type IVa secretion system protein [Colwellia sp.]